MSTMLRDLRLNTVSLKGRWHLWHWIIAILLVGQVFQQLIFIKLGGATRDNPFGPILIIMYVIAIFVLTISILEQGGLFQCLGRRGLRILRASILFGLVLAAGLSYTPAPHYGLVKTIGYFTFNLIPFFLILLAIETPNDLVHLLKAVLIIGFLASLITFVATLVLAGSFSGIGEIWQSKDHFYVLETKVDLGIWLSRRMMLLALTAMVMMPISKERRWTLGLLFVWFLYLAVLSAARGPFYFGLLTIFIVASLLIYTPNLKRLFLFASIGMVLFIIGKHIYYMPLVQVGSVLPVPVEVKERYDASLEDPEQSWAIRLDLFRSAYDVFSHNLITGAGTGGWSYIYNKIDMRDYPHNIFLEIAAELGLIGLAFFLYILLISYSDLRNMFDDIDKKSVIYLLGVYGLGVMAMALTNAQVSGDIITNEFVWIGAAIISKVSTMKDKAYLYVEESH